MTLRLPPTQLAWLDQHRSTAGLSRADLIRWCVAQAMAIGAPPTITPPFTSRNKPPSR